MWSEAGACALKEHYLLAFPTELPPSGTRYAAPCACVWNQSRRQSPRNLALIKRLDREKTDAGYLRAYGIGSHQRAHGFLWSCRAIRYK